MIHPEDGLGPVRPEVGAMNKEGKFGYHEAISLMVITIVMKVFFTSPAILVSIVGTAGWYMNIISMLTAIVGFMILYLLLKRFNNKNIMQISDLVLGKPVGSITLLVLTALLLQIASINMREYVEVMKIYVMPESPPSFLMILLSISVAVLSYMGLETIARYSKFIIYILTSGFILVIILSTQNFIPRQLYAVLGYGLDKTIIVGLQRCSVYGEIAILGIIASSLQGHKEIKKIGLWSIIISGTVLSISLLAYSLVFPYTVGQEITSPMYDMASLIDYGGFLQRMEPIFLFLWNFGSFIEIAIIFYAAMMVYCHVFKIEDKRPIILPMITILYCLNLIPRGISEVISVSINRIRTWGGFLFFIPSLILLIAAVIRKKKEA